MKIIRGKEFGNLNGEDLADFESANKIKFPDDYKQFLEVYNGGIPVPNLVPSVKSDVRVLCGMHLGPNWANFWDHVETFHSRIPSWYVPIGNDSGGNLYIMCLWEENHELIAFWKHEEEAKENADQYFDNVCVIANSFTQFLSQLTDKI